MSSDPCINRLLTSQEQSSWIQKTSRSLMIFDASRSTPIFLLSICSRHIGQLLLVLIQPTKQSLQKVWLNWLYKYPQKSLVGWWNTYRQTEHFRMREIELGFLKRRSSLMNFGCSHFFMQCNYYYYASFNFKKRYMTSEHHHWKRWTLLLFLVGLLTSRLLLFLLLFRLFFLQLLRFERTQLLSTVVFDFTVNFIYHWVRVNILFFVVVNRSFFLIVWSLLWFF